MPTVDGDGWSVGASYEEFMGRWSRLAAARFVDWIDPEPGGHWLDVGTGTGALAAAICVLAQPGSVVACDAAGPFIETARQRLADPRVTFEVAGIGSLPLRQGGYDAVVSGLALNFFPDLDLAVREQLSVAATGGLVGAYVWDYTRGMEFLRYFWDAATVVEPEAAELDEGRRFPVCQPEALESLFHGAGAERVRVGSVSVATRFSSFEDFWRPFLGGTGPAPQLVSALGPDHLRQLEAELRRRLPIADSGRIDLRARAWAVVGYKP